MFEQAWVRESVLGRMRTKECVQGVSLSVCVCACVCVRACVWVCVGVGMSGSVCG